MTYSERTYGRTYSPPPARHPASLRRLFRFLYSGWWVGVDRDCQVTVSDRLWRAIHRAA